MAFDILTDVTNTAQLLLISGGKTEFEVSKELTCVNNLHGTTTGKNMFKVEKTLIFYNLKQSLLRCVKLMVVKICTEKKYYYLTNFQNSHDHINRCRKNI